MKTKSRRNGISGQAMLLTLIAVGLVAEPLVAASFGDLEYEENGASVTITGLVSVLTEDVVIPATIDGKPVTAIGAEAFHSYDNIKTVQIPASVTSIGRIAFFGCSGLTQLKIPGTVKSIGESAFDSCKSMKELTIQNGVTSLGSGAFYNCTSLESVTIPGSITHISEGAFSYCRNIKEVIIENGVVSIGDNGFENCTSLESLTLPASVTKIGNFAFDSCKRLTKVSIPKNVTRIGSAAFASCSALTEITIPSKVTEIAASTFEDCGSLVSVVLPSRLERIEGEAFRSCKRLRAITFPKGLKSIGEFAFMDCRALKSATFLGDAPTLDEEIFWPSLKRTGPFTRVAPDFRVFYSEGSSGFLYRGGFYALPQWENFDPTLLADARISVQQPLGSFLKNSRSKKSFGTVPVKDTGTARTFVITNSGTKKLTGLQIALQGQDVHDFKLSNLAKASLNPGEQTSFVATFSPRGKGVRNADLVIGSSDSGGEPFVIKLSGFGANQ